MENNETRSTKRSLIMSILTEKCPRCRKGNVFAENRNPFRFPVMNERCTTCDFKFDREPGYFLGAMYVSYGLAVLEGIVTFLACHFLFPDMATIWIPVSILGVILLLAYKNYKLSRVIYIHIFPW